MDTRPTNSPESNPISGKSAADKLADSFIDNLISERVGNKPASEQTPADIQAISDEIDEKIDSQPELASMPDKKIEIRRKIATKVIAILLALGVGFGLLSLLLGNGKDKASETIPEPSDFTDTTDANPSTELTATNPIIITESSETIMASETSTENSTTSPEIKVDYSKPPTNVVEGYLFETLSPEQQAEIKSMEAMTIEEFRALPQEQQLKFSYWVYTNFKGRAEYIMKNFNIDTSYTESPITAEDYAKNYQYLYAFAGILDTWSGKDEDGLVQDVLTTKKIGALLYTTTDNHNEHWDTIVTRFESITKIMNIDPIVSRYKIDKNNSIIEINLKDNETVFYEGGSTQSQLTFEKISFVTIEGLQKELSVCSYEITTDAPNYIDRIGD